VTDRAHEFEVWYRLVVADDDQPHDMPEPDQGLRAWLQALFQSHGPVSTEVVQVAFVLDQVALADRAVASVLGDLHRTSSFRPKVNVDDVDGSIRITVNGSYTTPSMSAAPFDVAAGIVEVADYLQEKVIDNAGPVWPVCPWHGFGLHPQVNVGRAMWWCRPLDHPVSVVGELRT
jgi:hypothetical protein